MAPHPMSIPDPAPELQTQRSTCLLDSAAWRYYDHCQLSASHSEPTILPLTWSSLCAPISGPVFLATSSANGEKPTSCTCLEPTHNNPNHACIVYLLLTLLPTTSWLIPVRWVSCCFLYLVSSPGSGPFQDFPLCLACLSCLSDYQRPTFPAGVC